MHFNSGFIEICEPVDTLIRIVFEWSYGAINSRASVLTDSVRTNRDIRRVPLICFVFSKKNFTVMAQ